MKKQKLLILTVLSIVSSTVYAGTTAAIRGNVGFVPAVPTVQITLNPVLPTLVNPTQEATKKKVTAADACSPRPCENKFGTWL